LATGHILSEVLNHSKLGDNLIELLLNEECKKVDLKFKFQIEKIRSFGFLIVLVKCHNVEM